MRSKTGLFYRQFECAERVVNVEKKEDCGDADKN